MQASFLRRLPGTPENRILHDELNRTARFRFLKHTAFQKQEERGILNNELCHSDKNTAMPTRMSWDNFCFKLHMILKTCLILHFF